MAAPKVVGGYEVVDRLAVGGMAEIYIARTRGIDDFEKQYVLKLIHPKHSGDRDFVRMLIDEAKLTGQLHHVNIVQVISLGTHDDQYFIVMEYVRGKDLYQILNQAYDLRIPMPLDVCTYIAKEVCAGLDYAHKKRDEKTNRPLNLVHRDVSPQNVLVSWNGEVKVADFGVAKAAVAARPETQAGVIKGKFRYMSPEQAWGEKLDGRSDIFAVGLCLYEMITSSMAYEDEPDMRKMLARMREAKFQPARGLRSDLDNELDEILMRALRRRKQDRYPDAHDFELSLTSSLSARTPAFTRARVAAFLAKLFPEESPNASEAVVVSKMDDPATQPIALQGHAEPKKSSSDTNTDEIDSNALIEEEMDSEEHTIRQSILGHKLAKTLNAPEETDEFESEKTELFGQQHVDDDAEMTASLFRLTIPDTQDYEKRQPQPIPTSWLPKEVPNSFPIPSENVANSGPEMWQRKAIETFNELMAHPQQRWIALGVILMVFLTFFILMIFLLVG